MTQGLVVLLALLAAVCMAIGIVVRQRATIDVPHEYGVSAHMLTTLLRKRLWWLGSGVAVAGYGFQALALTKGSILLVQPLMVSSLLFALPLSARLAGRRVTRAEWLWALLLTTALAAFVALARPKHGDYVGNWVAWGVVAAVLTPLIFGCVLVGARSAGPRRAVLLSVAVGVLFGVVATLTKMVMHVVDTNGPVALALLPGFYVLVAVGLLATLLQQSAFHAGALKVSVPTMLVLEPVIAVLLSSLVFGEHLTLSGVRMLVLPIVVLAMAAATIALARDEGAYEDQLEAELAQRSE
ncbi:hypothetical protein BST27_08700 [Mycobacterium intermedium]|uniref:Multidrug DMT transporter permease n=1 Tax=Mycobacterium intermedium TaxID=28445 RepID=A0A1E3SB14_MYCIE|nr:DMT family transporter [Mycobacterium intermedium]MCV6967486.1 DMT family transporter [Mycobacterium intermedium]ODQ99350.1 hypothetical protein BHQ20_17495 [Mycobacterium intermedium]ORB07813.1 hypothetical protein BST27_08700 [Mycobacterium intermedium]